MYIFICRYYAILYKDLEHLWIFGTHLVGGRRGVAVLMVLEPNSHIAG